METKNKLKNGLKVLALGIAVMAFAPIASANLVVGYYGGSWNSGYSSPSYYGYAYSPSVFYSGSYGNDCCGYSNYYYPSSYYGYSWY